MDNEIALLSMLSTWNNRQQEFSKQFQAFAQSKMDNFVEHARIFSIGNDTFIQVDSDTFRRIDTRMLRNFENVKEIIVTYSLHSTEPCAYGYYVNGRVEDFVSFRCKNIVDILVHLYDAEQYRVLFQNMRNADFVISMNFDGLVVHYNDGSTESGYQNLELFWYHFFYANPGDIM